MKLDMKRLASLDKTSPKEYNACIKVTDTAMRVLWPKRDMKRLRNGIRRKTKIDFDHKIQTLLSQGIGFSDKAKVLLWRHLLLQNARRPAYEFQLKNG